MSEKDKDEQIKELKNSNQILENNLNKIKELHNEEVISNQSVELTPEESIMDAMVSKLWEDAEDASTAKKAAVAVFTALVIKSIDLDESNAVEKIWTPNMIFYVWPNYEDLIPMSKHVLQMLKTIMNVSENEFYITIKYMSISRHSGLLQKLTNGQVIDAEAFIETL